MDKGGVKEGILFLLLHESPGPDGAGFTFEEIRRFLEFNDVKGYFEDTKKARAELLKLLEEMKKNNFVEKRGGFEHVDYTWENAGMHFLAGRGSPDEVGRRWKIPLWGESSHEGEAQQA
ncbi:MAG TPA: hypothetical protein HA254_05510 [Candidatus Diapherotrites archaeon]|uniref:Uncharacterized protein n=1 Tax=Candidatus Iainarchaeum sp. TaxID=3101447 RepID=A0A7J4IYZ8_9ARCH|nr:hypothetical protein [Candidatus Diapherotrites archaeon]